MTAGPGHRHSARYRLTEILVTLALTSIVVAGLIQATVTHSRGYIDRDQDVSMRRNLQMGMDAVVDVARSAGLGVPTTNLAAWVSWIPGFTKNPLIIRGGAGADALSFAACFRGTLARLSDSAAAGTTTLSLASETSGQAIPDLFDGGAKSLILIGESQWARVISASGSTLNVDTDPVAAGVQGLARHVPQGTPVCRVEVWTVAIRTDPATGIPGLTIDDNLGSGAVELAQAISDLQVDEISAGKQYRVTLAARSENPVSGREVSVMQSLQSLVTLKD